MLLSGNKTISLNKDGYEPFIDFLKAYAILCVVVGHALPVALYDYTLFYIWGGMQVPMFVLVQTFHVYKKDVRPRFDFSHSNGGFCTVSTCYRAFC